MPNTLYHELTGRRHDTHMTLYLFLLGGLAHIGDFHIVVLLQLIIKNIVILFGEKDCCSELFITELSQASHCSLQHKYL